MIPPYDAIVVGARCCGSPTAMLLARKGYFSPTAPIPPAPSLARILYELIVVPTMRERAESGEYKASTLWA